MKPAITEIDLKFMRAALQLARRGYGTTSPNPMVGAVLVKGGQVIGASDKQGAFVADRPVAMGDIYATIYKSFGIDWTKEYMHPIGRPSRLPTR